MSDTRAPPVEMITRGAVPEDAIDLAVLKVRSQLRTAHDPVLFARVKLETAADAGSGGPAIAQASIDLNGHRVRAQAAAESMRTAIELMCDKLSVQLDRAVQGWPSRTLPQPRSPAEAPSVVTHKSYDLSRLTPDEAIADLEMLDYDFHLFSTRPRRPTISHGWIHRLISEILSPWARRSR